MVEARLVGQKINGLRRVKGLTQEQLGAQLNISAQAVSKWEKGDSLPDISILADLAAFLECTADFLLGNEGSLSVKLPQILAELSKTADYEQIDFLGQIVNTIGRPQNESHYPGSETVENLGLPYINIGSDGLNVWVKQKFICIATPEYLKETRAFFQEHVDIPFNVIPKKLLDLLIALMPESVGHGPDFAVTESKLREMLPPDTDFNKLMDECIELGFVERVRGGFRLNTKADIAMWLFSLVHRTISKPGAMCVWYKSS